MSPTLMRQTSASRQHTSWVDEAAGMVFCLVDAPDRQSADRVHREAHGLVATILFEVEQGA